MPRPAVIRLGTRGSLLAIAQSRLVARAVESSHPDTTVNLVPLSTRGDYDQHTPLPSVDDPDFFSGSLDQALLSGRVDFVVHSRKDLGENRPDGICTAAMPVRADPRDAIVFRADVPERLRAGAKLRVGTSSLRRRAQVADFLGRFLPATGLEPAFDFRPLRGPVDQRLLRIRRDPNDDDALDAVVLALAGLERLWTDSDGRRAIEPLLDEARWMVLPLSVCPAAPGQAALAVECRRDDPETAAILSVLHDPTTAKLVNEEFQAALSRPENERAGFAATAIRTTNLDQLLFTRGIPDTEGSRLGWRRPPQPQGSRPWCVAAPRHFRTIGAKDLPNVAAGPVFVAHWRAAAEGLLDDRRHRIWVSGIKSWERLARRGLWIEGCGDHLGFETLRPTLASGVLHLPALPAWTVLTRVGAEASWRGTGIGRVLGSYELMDVASEPDIDTLRSATHLFWSSVEQFQRFRAWIPPGAQHACGSGKTADALRELGLAPEVFPNREEWQAWLA